eukprot:6539069-Pyramimonas_sp.AAC.1
MSSSEEVAEDFFDACLKTELAVRKTDTQAREQYNSRSLPPPTASGRSLDNVMSVKQLEHSFR